MCVYYVCMCVHVCVCVYMYVCTCVFMCVCKICIMVFFETRSHVVGAGLELLILPLAKIVIKLDYT